MFCFINTFVHTHKHIYVHKLEEKAKLIDLLFLLIHKDTYNIKACI